MTSQLAAADPANCAAQRFAAFNASSGALVHVSRAALSRVASRAGRASAVNLALNSIVQELALQASVSAKQGEAFSNAACHEVHSIPKRPHAISEIDSAFNTARPKAERTIVLNSRSATALSERAWTFLAERRSPNSAVRPSSRPTEASFGRDGGMIPVRIAERTCATDCGRSASSTLSIQSIVESRALLYGLAAAMAAGTYGSLRRRWGPSGGAHPAMQR